MSRPPQAAVRPSVTAPPPPPPPRTAAASSDGFISLGAMRVAAPILSTQASRQPRQSSTAPSAGHGVSSRLPVSGASASLHAHHPLPSPTLSSASASSLKPMSALGGTSQLRASITSSSGARGGRASASSTVQPYSSALISAAFQEQFMRDLRLDFRAPASSSHSNHAGAVLSSPSLSSQSGSNSHPQALAQRIGLQGVLQHTQQLLHLSHAAGAAPVASLGAAEWAAAREQSRRRGDSTLPCAICHDDFGTAAQCLLSCTHTFHLSCITSFERFTGSLSCPLCRHTPYERRPIDDGLHAHRFKHAVRIQSWWRGLRARSAFFRMRDAEAPSDPALRRRFVERKMERVGRHLQGMVEDGGDEIDALFAEIDGNLHDSRATMLNVALPSLPTAEDSVSDADNAVRAAWALARRQADVRCDTECPICMVEFRDGPKARALVLLSCTHVFHDACLNSFEQYARNERPTCPMCRAEYEKIPYT